MLQVTEEYPLYTVRAEIVPAPRGRRPWPGYWSRWWYEVDVKFAKDDYWTTYAYSPGGSGGGWSLRRCLWNAYDAVFEIGQRIVDEPLAALVADLDSA